MEFIAIYAIYTTYTIITLMIIIIPHVRATPIFISGISVLNGCGNRGASQSAGCMCKKGMQILRQFRSPPGPGHECTEWKHVS